MSLLAAIRRLWNSIAPRTDSDVEEEFRSTLDAYQDDLVRHGLPEEEARRKARIDLGRPAAQYDTYRDAIGLRLFDELGGDIGYGLRALRRNPGFAAVAVLSLALGIGATTAMFSLIYAVLLHPFPYADADRIMNPHLVDEQHPDEFSWFALSKAQCDDLRLAAPVESVLGFSNGNLEITSDGLPEDISGVYLTENAETFFGVHPLFGRMIEPFDAGHPVVVLNYRFWQRYFGGDPHVIGRTLEIDHAPYTIVGVMPRSFAFNDIAGVGDVYLPASLMRAVANGPAPSYLPWIKLRPHVTVAAANAALEPIVREMMHSGVSAWHLGLQPIIVPYQQNLGRTLALLLAGVVLLLIIGCANCSILLLGRGRARQHELAIRTAIGASCSSKLWSSPARAPSWAWLRRTGLPGFPCCCLRTPFQPNPSSASTLPSSRFPSRSRCSAASSSVSPPHCVSRATILRALSRAGRLAWSLLLQSIAGAFSSRRRSRSRFFLWPPRALPSAAFSGSRRCPSATIPPTSCR
jgi:hypothetical protein